MALKPNEKNADHQIDDATYNEWLRQHELQAEVASEEVGVEGQAPVPRRDLGTGASVVSPKSGLFYGWAKLLIVLVPLLFLAGYYTYSSVSGATFFGVNLRNNVNLENGLVGHWTFDGGDMLSTSTTETALAITIRRLYKMVLSRLLVKSARE